MTNMNVAIPFSAAAILDGADCAGEVDENLIFDIEEQQKLKFPAEYRVFLKKYGAALLNGFEVYGLIEAKHAAEDGPPIWVDLRLQFGKPEFNGMPKGLIPISDNGGDYKFYLQCAPDAADATGSVIVYGPGVDGKKVASGFFEFLERAVLKGLTPLITA